MGSQVPGGVYRGWVGTGGGGRRRPPLARPPLPAAARPAAARYCRRLHCTASSSTRSLPFAENPNAIFICGLSTSDNLNVFLFAAIDRIILRRHTMSQLHHGTRTLRTKDRRTTHATGKRTNHQFFTRKTSIFHGIIDF